MIPILSQDESKDVQRCLWCNATLDKKHWRIMYCCKGCKDKAHISRRKAMGKDAKMTPTLVRKLEELRLASRRETELRR